MSVIPLTIFFSLLLAGLFVVLFAREQRRRRFSSAERDSLLPLADETPRGATPDRTPPSQGQPAGSGDHARQASHVDHDHSHDDEHEHGDHHHHGKGSCGCRDGTRPPCTGCLRRTGTTPLVSPSPLS